MFVEQTSPILRLTREEIDAWREQIARLEVEIAQKEREKEALKAKVAAVRLLLEDSPLAKTNGLAQDYSISEDTPVTEAMLRVLKEQTAGLLPKELAELLRQTAVGVKFARNPNSLYTNLKRLADRGEIVQHGRLIYFPHVFERVAEGRLSDPRFELAGSSVPDLRAVISATIKREGRALMPGELRERLGSHPHYGDRIRNRPNYLYNTLSRMLESGQVAKDEHGRYMLTEVGEATAGVAVASDLFEGVA